MVEDKRNFIVNLKAQVGCVESGCNVTNPNILVLHHVEPIIQERGSRQPSGFSWSRNGWPAIMKELKKCTVLCLNCHGLAHEKLRLLMPDCPRTTYSEPQFSLFA